MTANARTEANGKLTLRLRTANFDQSWLVIHGAMTVWQIAEQLGIDHRHFSQIRTGRRNPGTQVIAAIRVAMPHVQFDELWEVIEPESAEAGDAT